MPDAPRQPGPADREKHSEEWYFRIDGRKFGPSTRAQLETFLRPPRLCKSLEVMCTGGNGTWLLIQSHETIDTVLHRVGLGNQASTKTRSSKFEHKPSAASIRTHRISNGLEALTETASKYRVWIIAFLLLLLTNSITLYATSDRYAAERTVFLRAVEIWKSARSFDSKVIDNPEWLAFSERARTEVEGFTTELAAKANRSRPVTQELLFLVRDHLKPALSKQTPPTKGSAELSVIDRYLKAIGHQLR